MRCPKCGAIDFDYLETCKRCGAGLSAVNKMLGSYIMANNSLNWFDLARNAILAKSAVEGNISKTDAPLKISDIDVSDLVAERQSGDEVFEMDPDTLKNIASNERFQQALNDLIGEK